MKKLCLIGIILLLSACTVGDFSQNRQDLHAEGNNICEQQPSKCLNGVPW